jgi:DNA-binding response OmpR family regulator
VTRVGDLTIERDAKRVLRAGQPVDLTAKEYQLLDLFISQPGKVLSRTRILNKVWATIRIRLPTWWTSTSAACARR